MKPKFILKSDNYRKSRGGYSRCLEVRCEKCKGLVCFYQKDGPGPLKRLYIDRILQPQIFWTQKFLCKKCKSWLGVAMVYKKEHRKCFILFQNSVNKKITKI